MSYIVGDLIKKAKIEKCKKQDFPVLSMTMKDGIVFQNDRFKKQIASIDKSSYNIVKRNQLVVSFPIDEGVLAVQDIIDFGIVSPAYKIWDINDYLVIPKFLEAFLRSPHSIQYYKSKLHGSTARRRTITDSDLLQMEVPLVSFTEQKRILENIRKVKHIITHRRTQLEKLDLLVKARFVEMFGTLLKNPNNYPITTIAEVCSLIKDGTHQTPEYTDDIEEGYKFLSSKDVMSQKIDWSNIKYIPQTLHEKLYSTLKPQKNDILMSKNGVNYGVAAVNDTEEVFDIYVSLALLRPLDIINPIFFRCAINNPDTKMQFDGSIKGIGVPNLHLGEIKKTKILLPPLNEQKEYVTFVKQVDKSRVVVQKALDEAQLLFDSLMQEYFG